MQNAAKKYWRRFSNGVYYGYAPKIGEHCLIIYASKVTGNWQIDLKSADLPNGEYWFQLVDDSDGLAFLWGHGIVDQTGKIHQWG